MKAEKLILSIVAVLVGLLAAGGAFYLYQMTKQVPPPKAQPVTIKTTPTAKPTPPDTNLLTVDSPKDEEVFDKKIITVSGKTTSDATIIVTTEDGDQVVKPTSTGDFTLTQTIGDGTNMIQVTAVYQNGEEKRVTRTVTYSQEKF